jgi:uncharacterized protein YecE (DUF72 family)
MKSIWVGTSGWHYEHWRGPFYPPDLPASRMLEHYCRHFRTVEINNSFYRLPSRDTFRAWRDATPPGFRFVVKASRFITHMKKLKDPAPALALLFERATALKEKLGPVLFQLPPGWKLNIERFRDFLSALPGSHDFVFELRNESWMTDEVFELMERRGVGFCVYQLAGRTSPVQVTGRVAYVRLHGPGKAYQGQYSNADLRLWAARARQWTSGGKEVYVYFDNDQAGYAVDDARRLAGMLGEPTAGLEKSPAHRGGRRRSNKEAARTIYGP